MPTFRPQRGEAPLPATLDAGPGGDSATGSARAALPAAEDAIAAAIQRLFRAIEADDNDEAAGLLQGLVDQLLDAAPAGTSVLLERRLLGLARALEELGVRAPSQDLVSLAVRRSDSLH